MQLKLGQPFRRVVHDVVIKSTTSGSDSVAISRIEKFVRLDEVRSDCSDLEEEEENHEVDEEHLAQAQKLPHMKMICKRSRACESSADLFSCRRKSRRPFDWS